MSVHRMQPRGDFETRAEQEHAEDLAEFMLLLLECLEVDEVRAAVLDRLGLRRPWPQQPPQPRPQTTAAHRRR